MFFPCPPKKRNVLSAELIFLAAKYYQKPDVCSAPADNEMFPGMRMGHSSSTLVSGAAPIRFLPYLGVSHACPVTIWDWISLKNTLLASYQLFQR